jgi:hypothetical protein
VVPRRLGAQRGAQEGRRGRGLIEELIGRALLHDEVVRVDPVRRGRGGCEAAVLTFASGTTAFAKSAVDDEGREANLIEAEVLLRLAGRHAPRLLDVVDAGATILVEHLGDSSAGVVWAPPLPAPEALWQALDVTGAVTAPARLRRMRRQYDPWDHAPQPWWLGSPAWWRTARPVLRDAAASATWQGRQLVHGDVAAVNLALRDGGVVLVDWADAARGSLDWARVLAGLMYRLHGMPVEVPCHQLAPAVSCLAGFAADELATLGTGGDHGPAARLVTALQWAAELLSLDPPPLASGR